MLPHNAGSWKRHVPYTTFAQPRGNKPRKKMEERRGKECTWMYSCLLLQRDSRKLMQCPVYQNCTIGVIWVIYVYSNLLGHICIMDGILCGIDVALCDFSFRCLTWLSNHHIIVFGCTSGIWEKSGVFSPFQLVADHDGNAASWADNGGCKKQHPEEGVFCSMLPPTDWHDRTTAAVKVLPGFKDRKCTMFSLHTQLQWSCFHVATNQQSIMPVSGSSLLMDVDGKRCLDLWSKPIFCMHQLDWISRCCNFLLATGGVPVAFCHTPPVFSTVKWCEIYLCGLIKGRLTLPKHTNYKSRNWCSILLPKAKAPQMPPAVALQHRFRMQSWFGHSKSVCHARHADRSQQNLEERHGTHRLQLWSPNAEARCALMCFGVFLFFFYGFGGHQKRFQTQHVTQRTSDIVASCNMSRALLGRPPIAKKTQKISE